MKSSKSTTVNDAVWEYVKEHDFVSPETLTLINAANCDLYAGPSAVKEEYETYPGFERACYRIGVALDGVSDLWIDEDGAWSDVEPDWNEYDPAMWTHFDAHRVKRIIVGSELIQYL